uniref:Putative product n=1 Tax=Xenopsylla cheopis TaxID=163159 RepID=A0A6M2E007_XENCH
MLSSPVAFFLFLSLIALTTSDFSMHGLLSSMPTNSSCSISIFSYCFVFDDMYLNFLTVYSNFINLKVKLLFQTTVLALRLPTYVSSSAMKTIIIMSNQHHVHS